MGNNCRVDFFARKWALLDLTNNSAQEAYEDRHRPDIKPTLENIGTLRTGCTPSGWKEGSGFEAFRKLWQAERLETTIRGLRDAVQEAAKEASAFADQHLVDLPEMKERGRRLNQLISEVRKAL